MKKIGSKKFIIIIFLVFVLTTFLVSKGFSQQKKVTRLVKPTDITSKNVKKNYDQIGGKPKKEEKKIIIPPNQEKDRTKNVPKRNEKSPANSGDNGNNSPNPTPQTTPPPSPKLSPTTENKTEENQSIPENWLNCKLRDSFTSWCIEYLKNSNQLKDIKLRLHDFGFHTDEETYFYSPNSWKNWGNTPENAIKKLAPDLVNNATNINFIDVSTINHIFLAVYEKNTKTFYFYNSYGTMGEDFGKKFFGIMLKEMGVAESQIDSHIQKITVPHQETSYDCGMWVVIYMKILAQRYREGKNLFQAITKEEIFEMFPAASIPEVARNQRKAWIKRMKEAGADLANFFSHASS